MCRNSSDRGLSLRNGWISIPILGWNERKDLAKTVWFHGIPGLFWVFADHGPSVFFIYETYILKCQ